jgi:cytochrome P450
MALANPPDPVQPGYKRFRAAMNTLDRIIDEAIADRRRQPRDDLVTMLVEARDAHTGAAMNDSALRDEVVTTMFGAYKGISHALPWIWYLLSMHPDVDRRVRAEAAEALGGRAPTVQDLSRLSLTAMVAKEVLRLYPPLWALPREALDDDEIGGYWIPKGVTVVISPYITHRHPAFWDNPAGFDPDRFVPERSAGRHPYAYLPFGAGPRSCTGEHYALMLLTLVTAMVAQRYRLWLLPGHNVKRRREFLLRSITGMPTILEPLGGAAVGKDDLSP